MNSRSVRLALLCSGTGTNAAAIIDYFAGHRHIAVASLWANKHDAPALQKAQDRGIPTGTFTRADWQNPESLLETWRSQQVDVLVLAGFLWLVPPAVLRAFPDAVINIHPALLPKFGGKGMFGHHVHEAVVAAHETESGITIHLADEVYDHGKVLRQFSVPVLPHHSPQDVEQQVRALELQHYAPTIEAYIQQKWAL